MQPRDKQGERANKQVVIPLSPTVLFIFVVCLRFASVRRSCCCCWQECLAAMGDRARAEVYDACVYDVCLTRQNVTCTLCENIKAFVSRCGNEFKVMTTSWRDHKLCRRFFGSCYLISVVTLSVVIQSVYLLHAWIP
jgi:C8 domain